MSVTEDSADSTIKVNEIFRIIFLIKIFPYINLQKSSTRTCDFSHAFIDYSL